jgi:hypothetical protein
VCADSELDGNFAIFQPLRNELDDSLLPSAEFACAI